VKTSVAQRKASAAHRRRAAKRGLVRVEIQVPESDAYLLKELAAQLRGASGKAKSARSGIRSLLSKPGQTAFEMFASDLDDAHFDDVFRHDRRELPRDVDL
jgi:hypothetical protein